MADLQHAVSIYDNHNTLSDVEADHPVHLDKKLQQNCGHIIVIDTKILRFCHQSALDLFESITLSAENRETMDIFRCSHSESHGMKVSWSLVTLCAHQDWEDVVKLLRLRFNVVARGPDQCQRTLLHWPVENSGR